MPVRSALRNAAETVAKGLVNAAERTAVGSD